ncbi:MAG: heparan-alpha-glucosaminide N-acetyltransferase domain-containing protein [Myxococcales bacterium]
MARVDTATSAAPVPRTTQAPARLEVVDWLRGAAVVLMIQTHLYDAWVSPQAKLTAAYHWTRFFGGIPSRLFLMLVGVSIALRFEAQLAKGVTDRRALVRPVQKRGLEVLLLAYLFRMQEYVLGHMSMVIVDFPAYWRDILRIDILNCIGASMLVVPMLAAPRRGRPAWAATLAAMLLFVGLGPVIGPAHFPRWIPDWISAYIGGQRPMSWFGLFPWAAWPLAGVALGHVWVRASRNPRRQAWTFLATGVAGAVLILIVSGIRKVNPQVIRYPSELVQQMGPGSFFYRLGMNGIAAFIGWGMVRLVGRRFSVMRQFGRTSLLVYWIHIDFCYGLIAHRLGLFGRLNMRQATAGLTVIVALMLAVSLAKTRWWEPWRRRQSTARTAAAAARAPEGSDHAGINLRASAGPMDAALPPAESSTQLAVKPNDR